jgi:hypothetical protein
VLIDLPAKVTLDPVVSTDPLSDANYLFVRQVTSARSWIDTRVKAGLDGLGGADAIDIGKSGLETLVPWDIYSSDPCHVCLSCP